MVWMLQLISSLLLGSLGLAYFFGSVIGAGFLTKPGNYIKVTLLYTVLAALRRPIAGFVRALFELDDWIFADYVSMAVSLLIIALFCCRAMTEITVFTAVTAGSIILITECLSAVIVQELGRLEGKLGGQGFGTSEILIYSGLPVLLIQILTFRLIGRLFRENHITVRKKDLFYLIVPDSVGIFGSYLLKSIWQVSEGAVQGITSLRYVIPGTLLLCLISVVHTIMLFLNTSALNEARSSRAILERQNDSLQEHIREMERIQFGLRSLRHDMRNTISVTRELVNKNTAEGNEILQSYLSSLSKTIDSLELRFRTGNQVVDVLLNMKYHEALRSIPDITIDTECFCLPDTLSVQGYDISVMLGNAMDNAIEACRKLKQINPNAEAIIQLSSLLKGKTLLLEIKNSYDGAVILEGKNGLPLTIKKDKELHGIGMLNIQRIAGKYHGAVNWSTDRTDKNRRQDYFILSIMLKNEPPVD